MLSAQAKSVQRAVANQKLFWLVLAAILLVATILRFAFPGHPGFDVDESTYSRIAANAERGFLGLKAEYDQPDRTYLFHPPFYFLLLAGWFLLLGQHGIEQSRLLASTAGVVTVLMVALFLRRFIGNWSLLAAAFLAMDGWIVFTNRIGWMENVQFVLGIGALWLYWRAHEKPTYKRFALAGVILAMAMVFKFVGAYFLLTALLCWLITQRHHRKHLALVAGTGMVLGGYLVGMTIWSRALFWSETVHQLKRALGLQQSRGAVQSTSDVITPLLHQYGIYAATVAMLAGVGVLIGFRLLQCLRHWSWAPVRDKALLFSWAVTAYAIFGLAGLKLPHYLFLIILPAYCYLVAELRQFGLKQTRLRLRKATIIALTAVVVLAGTCATYNRVVVHSDNAVGRTIAFMNQSVPHQDHVIADEFMGQDIPQPYCNINRAVTCEKHSAQYLISYETTTQKLPPAQAISRMIRQGTLVFETRGFKEHIRVYRLRPYRPSS